MINKTILPYFLFISLCIPQLVWAQQSLFQVKGKVASSDNTPLEYATVILLENGTHTSLDGTTTNSQGEFILKSTKQNVSLSITFLGYKDKLIPVDAFSNGTANLGTILLEESVQSVDEVVIQGEKSSTEFKLDKRVFNVGKDLSSSGASALDVLNNVPSVNVNIEGQISLRGSSGVQILINGKPSVIASEEGNAMGTITADMIEKIEVITNPSAKYEAEGTSGIINIVLKKDERKGINGSFTINIGVPHNHSFGLSLNRRTEKFNLFAQLGGGYRELPNDVTNNNTNLSSNTTLNTVGEQFRNENFYNFILGTDYYINPTNVITLSGSFSYEIEDQPSQTDFTQVDGDGNVLAEWRRTEVTEALNPKYQYELQYKKDFKDNKKHDLLFSVLGNLFAKDQSSEFLNESISGSGIDGRQRTSTSFGESRYTFKLDYTKPINDKITLETGAQYVINDVSNDFSVSNFFNETWVVDSGLTNVFEYDQKVLGVYGTGAYEGKKWGLKLGLRAENTDLKTFLVNTNETNKQDFTNLFPSAHTSFKFTERLSVMGGYSRRIRRPRLWDLNPFFNIRNNFSIRVGNPDLLPEFTDSYELTAIYVLDDLSMNVGVFNRFTSDVIERVSFFENEINTVTPLNIGTNSATGIEFNGKYSPVSWWSINGDFNYLYFNRKGEFENTNFDFTGTQWSARLNTKFSLKSDLDIEITGNYRSSFKTVQSVVSDVTFMNLGLRKKILKGRGVINLSVRDLFASRIQESQTIQPEFTVYNRRFRGRFIVMGFSYGFGKGEAMEFSAGRRRY
ncbi:MAG: outer membrane beta-barrel family protein [Bacteroidota bacterium]